MADTKSTLEERGKTYGVYLDQTKISYGIRKVMEGGACNNLETDQQDALIMIATKISRILNGNPDYSDSWLDIAGYATLVAERLEADAH